MKTLLSTLLIVLLAGCATPPVPPVPGQPPRAQPKPQPKPGPTPALEIDRSLSATGQSSRVKFIIVHYTVSNLPQSIKILTKQVVSSHYLLTDEAQPVIYGLVDEERQSNHAGVSSWKNYTLLNGSSIGIEIVNPGYTEGPDGRVYAPFAQAQIDKLILLIKDIVARHKVPPENILGHSDIAPQRKQDPGPMFPWAQLAMHGLVLWPDAGKVEAARAVYEVQLPDVAWFQKKLAVHGYAVPQTGELDEATRTVLSVFQMKYRARLFDGTPDAETAALLEALNPTPVVLPGALPAPIAAPPAGSAPLFIKPVAPAPVPIAPPPSNTAPLFIKPLVPPAPSAPAPPSNTAPLFIEPVVPPAVAQPEAPAPVPANPAPAPANPVPVQN